MRLLRITLPATAVVLLLCILSPCAIASIFGSIRGIVHDPQHRPVADAMVMLHAEASDWSATTNTDATGQFSFAAVPLGEYTVTVASPGFVQTEQAVRVKSGSEPVLHFQLNLSAVHEFVNVSGAPETAPTDSATPTSLIDRQDVARTPGATRTNSLAVITDYVPGTYVTHDQLHIRGGHQVSWLIDGVPVPNTNIASNVGPQFDPKDMDYLEVQRGSYEASEGDRTYGVFNVLPRTGFERNREAELVLSAGNFYQTNDQLSFGSHTSRFAYYVSLNGSRSNLGLETPTALVVHDTENGYGGFGSLIFNANPSNQLRLVSSARRDYYQIPFDPDPGSVGNQDFPSSGFRDAQHEADAFVNFSWVHTFNSKLLLTASPFYHFNQANYDAPVSDFPSATSDHRSSNYGGGQIAFTGSFARNNLQVGGYGFGQQDNQLLEVISNSPAVAGLSATRQRASGGLASFFFDDKFTVFPGLTVTAGVRPTHFDSRLSENAVSPRFGAALTVPRLHWTFRAFYGHYYQAPPLLTASGPLLQFCQVNNCGFIPLNGERDEEHQFGLTIPYKGWILDADTFATNAHNFFDHSNVGESNVFFPLTIALAHIRGWELTLRSPRLVHRAQFHLAYSNQIAAARGPITGGLTDFSPGQGFFPLDHDQRNTLNVGADFALPSRVYISTNVYYGSGFTDGNFPPPAAPHYLPQHTTFDLSIGKDFHEHFSASVNALNVANRHLLTDNSLTFGGFHWNNPREIYMELRYRFHY
jgi:TonB dependent receptor-like, beta-barrel/Carboxypeptidase regulatory-like domain/TonB-dependent Receptor Plug Domain